MGTNMPTQDRRGDAEKSTTPPDRRRPKHRPLSSPGTDLVFYSLVAVVVAVLCVIFWRLLGGA